jgi:hypothetical protein
MSVRVDNSEARNLHVPRPSFVQQAGFKDLSEIAHLRETDLVEMCTLYPAVMAQLIVELSGEWRKTVARLAIKERKEEQDKAKQGA